MTFAENLIAARKRAKMSQHTLSKRSGVSQSAISFIEKGERSPSESTMKMLADALRVPLSTLIGEEKPAVENDGLDAELINLLMSLRPEDAQRVRDFVAGLLAAQEE